MDNIPKENEQGQSQAGGEIYSNTAGESAYQEAIAVPETDTAQSFQESQTQISGDSSPGVSLGNSGNVPPPPFTQDNKKKKFIVFGIGGLVILLVLFFIFNLIFNNKPKPPKTITLTYWGLWEDKDIMQPIIDEYKKTHGNITINYIKQDPKQYRERLNEELKKGEGPDIFRFHNTWVPMMINYLVPIPKDIYSVSDFTKIFYPVATSDLKVGENIYGIPLMIDGLLLYYNEDILKSANVPVPSTWEDVQKALPKLTVKQKGKIVTAGIALGAAENVEHFSDILGLMLLQNGTILSKSLFSCATSSAANVADSISSANNSSNTTCGTETLTYYHKFAETPNNTWDETLDNSIVAFTTGKLAMMLAPSWEVYTIKTIPGGDKINFKTAKVPQLPCDKQPCATMNWATYWVEGVSNKSTNQKEAWEFLKYLSDANTMKKLYELETKSRTYFGEPYSRVDLAKSLSDHPYLGALMTEAPTMKSFYSASRTNDGDTGINSRIITYLKNAVNSMSAGGSSETALKTADAGFKQVYTDWKLIAPAPTQ